MAVRPLSRLLLFAPLVVKTNYVQAPSRGAATPPCTGGSCHPLHAMRLTLKAMQIQMQCDAHSYNSSPIRRVILLITAKEGFLGLCFIR